MAKKMGKTRVIAETGAGQHGVATATAQHFLEWNVKYLWERKIPNVRHLMYTVWNY